MGRLLEMGSILLATAVSGGCATTPSAPLSQPSASAAQPPIAVERALEIAAAAQSLVGAPYRYGGSSPRGFDCSGLVHYVHASAGIEVPRTAAAQRAAARPVEREGLQAGDLVFFSDLADKTFHVGIYVGAGRFIHAPMSGRRVSYASLHEEYYRRHFAGGGRLH